jgi:two-component system sensor histidine kinase UhpB
MNTLASERPRVPSPVRASARGRRPSLYRRLFVAYTTVLAGVALLLIFAPVTISEPVTTSEVIGILGAFVVMLVIFHFALHRLLGPLERLTALMRTIDPLAPGQRVDVGAHAEEVAALSEAFNGMLDRLEGERRESARRALSAQESERQRIARELHDEVGQLLTGIVLRSETLARRAGDELRPDLEDLREVARHAAEEARDIARRLRPEALDELGLQSALLALCNAASSSAGIEITRDVERVLPLSPEQELVIYRVAQESITNVVRHAGARRIDLELKRDAAGGVVLSVRDDGAGMPAVEPAGSNGVRGMRERALLVGADLRIAAGPRGGTEVRLTLPPEEVA